MLIDFKKPFDSVSWKCSYKTLKLFNFSEDDNILGQSFNINITTYTMQLPIRSYKNPKILSSRRSDHLVEIVGKQSSLKISIIIKIKSKL